MSLSQEERRVSLSQEEERFPNYWGDESRLPHTTHGEKGPKFTYLRDLTSKLRERWGAWSTTRQGSKGTKNPITPWADHIPKRVPREDTLDMLDQRKMND